MFPEKIEIYDYMVPLIVFSALQVLYAFLIGVLWKKRYWTFQQKLEYDFGTKGKGMISQINFCSFFTVYFNILIHLI
ncbi:hypothetical protein C2G38_2109999, partial [Gigaspora rosea]